MSKVKAENDLVNSKIEIAPGVLIDDRLRLGGMMFLEQMTGKTFTEIAESLSEKQQAADMYNILLALVVQANGDMDIKEAERIVKSIEIDNMMNLLGRLKIFSIAPKNLSEPNSQSQKLTEVSA
jgi:hypothetical protein